MTQRQFGKHPCVLTLWQAERCPHSRKVRERLTELGVDYVARQVEPEAEERHEMRRELGTDEIPVLVDDNAALHCGEDDAIAWLDEHFGEGEHEAGPGGSSASTRSKPGASFTGSWSSPSSQPRTFPIAGLPSATR